MDDSPEGEDRIEKNPGAAAGCSRELEVTAGMTQPHHPWSFQLDSFDIGRMDDWKVWKASEIGGREVE